MESINLCPPKITTEISSVYSSAPPTKIKIQEEDIYLRNIRNLKNIVAILGSGKWILKGCQELKENNTTFILEGTVAIINKENDEIELISVKKQKYSDICYILKEENAESYSVIKSLIFDNGNSTEINLKWNEFKKIGNLKEILNKNDELTSTINNLKNEMITLKQNAIPKGGIIMWSGNNIPEGYALCDGKNGTPNLLNKFIIGSGENYKVGNTGGNEKIKLSVNQLPSHNHNFSAKYIQKSGTANSVYVIPGGNDDWNYPGYKICETNKVGNGDEIDIRPPFYALAYIIKL